MTSFLCWFAELQHHLVEDHQSGVCNLVLRFSGDATLSACSKVLLYGVPIHDTHTHTMAHKTITKIPGARDPANPDNTTQHINTSKRNKITTSSASFIPPLLSNIFFSDLHFAYFPGHERSRLGTVKVFARCSVFGFRLILGLDVCADCSGRAARSIRLVFACDGGACFMIRYPPGLSLVVFSRSDLRQGVLTESPYTESLMELYGHPSSTILSSSCYTPNIPP